MEPDKTLSNPAAWLESVDGNVTPVVGNCSIGRAAGNEVVLQDDKVSRRHAMVHAQGQGEFWIVDLGSSNGTYVNARRVAQPCRLNHGDRIGIGGFVLVFSLASPPSQPTTDRTSERTIQDIRTLECWLLVIDLEDSTQWLKSLPAEQVPRVTGRWLAECKQLIEAHQGVLNKFLGDGLFAYWTESGDTAIAVSGTLRGLALLQGAPDSPRFRFVLHRGKVFAGGGASLGEESLMGTEVNFVFRMEKLAGSLGVPTLVSEPARSGLGTHVTTTGQGSHPLNSFDGEFPFFSVAS